MTRGSPGVGKAPAIEVITRLWGHRGVAAEIRVIWEAPNFLPMVTGGDRSDNGALTYRTASACYPKNCCLIAFLNASSPICRRAA